MMGHSKMHIATAVLLYSLVSYADSPITVSIPPGKNIATMTNAVHPGNRIGYRFHEHTPLIHGEIPAASNEQETDPVYVDAQEKAFAARAGVLVKRVDLDDADWLPQTWTFYFAPADDGLDLLWIVHTKDRGLNEYYGVQQCFRLGGVSNQAWRREFAETPAFSEYDLWDVTQKDDAKKTSLSYVVRNGTWEALPATRDPLGARTPLGVNVDTLRSSGNLAAMLNVGPYEAAMLEPVDGGLVMRVNIEKTWVCGIYWQRTSHVTDHHPADCLHSIVNLGGLPPDTRRALRGKIYWFEGSLDELFMRWKRDFPQN